MKNQSFVLFQHFQVIYCTSWKLRLSRCFLRMPSPPGLNFASLPSGMESVMIVLMKTLTKEKMKDRFHTQSCWKSGPVRGKRCVSSSGKWRHKWNLANTTHYILVNLVIYYYSSMWSQSHNAIFRAYQHQIGEGKLARRTDKL